MSPTARRLLVSLALLAGACADGDPEPSQEPSVWVGRVTDSDIAFAAVSSEQSATLFFCGGPSSLVEGTRWFSKVAPLKSGFSAVSGDVSVSGSVTSETIEGVYELGAGSQAFTARRAPAGTLAGLYDGFSPCGHIGLIVFPDDTAGGRAQGTCLRVIAGAVEVEQVNPVMPLVALADRGIQVGVAADPELVIVHPLIPAE